MITNEATSSDELSEFEKEFINSFANEDLDEPTVEPAEEAQIEEDSVIEEDVIEQEEEQIAQDTINYKQLFELEEQRRKTVEGRFKKAREDWKAKEDELHSKSAPVSDNAEFWELNEELRQPVIDLITSIVNDRLAEIKTSMASIQDTVATTSEEAHFNTISAAHPDFKQIASGNEIKVWMNSLPYKTEGSDMDGEEAWRIFNSGSAVEVIHLFNVFKSSRKDGEPKNDKHKQKVPTPNSASDKLVRKVTASLAVDSGTPIVPQSESKRNKSFEEEFLEFVKKG